MVELASRRWPVTSITAALGLTGLGYVLLAPTGGGPQAIATAPEIPAPEAPDAAADPVPEGTRDGIEAPETAPPLEEAKGDPGAPATARAGLYAMKGYEGGDGEAEPGAEPPSHRHAGEAGVLGVRGSEADEDVWGGLVGDEVGEAYGVGGLGLTGTGRGGGGTGEGTIGLGSFGTVGKGGGGGARMRGSGSGYGRGPGGDARPGFDAKLQGRTLTVGTVDDFQDPKAWASATEKLEPARQALGLDRKWLEMQGPGPRHVDQPRALDVALVLDTTGSMGDELEYLKVELRDIATAVGERFPAVDQRWSLVVYRDVGDEYVVRAQDFTQLEKLVAVLAEQSAAGGGDFPEAMDRALEHSAQLSWKAGPDTARMVFLVADAPPHAGGAAGRFVDAVAQHRDAKVAIYPVSGSGVDDSAELAMRIAARVTGGQYIYLTDHSGIGGSHKKPHTEETKIETLHDVMLRLISEELGAEGKRQTPPKTPPETRRPPAPEAQLAAVVDREQADLDAVVEAGASMGWWAALQARLAEHFLFAVGVALATFAAMGVDTARRRRRDRAR